MTPEAQLGFFDARALVSGFFLLLLLLFAGHHETPGMRAVKKEDIRRGGVNELPERML